jgi:cytochrome b involved in lipid metabolism
MEEEFKKPAPIHPGSFFGVPTPNRSGAIRKDKNAKPHIEFIRMIENNRDPLGRGGKGLEVYTMEQVAEHNSANDAWIVLNGKVYDMTLYLNHHPGGKIIMSCAGKDGTHLFMRYHPWVNIEGLIGKLQIGTINNMHLI